MLQYMALQILLFHPRPSERVVTINDLGCLADGVALPTQKRMNTSTVVSKTLEQDVRVPPMS